VARDLSCGQLEIYLELEMRRVACAKCGAVKRERLDWLADIPFYTKRFAFYVGRRCRDSTIKAVAEELRLDWKTVKELDKQYMREQVRRMGRPTPLVNPEKPVRRPELRALSFPVQDLDLVPQGQVLKEELLTGLERADQRPEQDRNHVKHRQVSLEASC